MAGGGFYLVLVANNVREEAQHEAADITAIVHLSLHESFGDVVHHQLLSLGFLAGIMIAHECLVLLRREDTHIAKGGTMHGLPLVVLDKLVAELVGL